MTIEEKQKIELQIINNFIVKEKRQRFTGILKNRTIGDGFGQLAHVLRYLDLRFFIKIPSMSTEKEIQFVIAEIRKRSSASNCYVISEDKTIDGREMNIENALQEVVGGCRGTFLAVEGGNIVFHESEAQGERYFGWR